MLTLLEGRLPRELERMMRDIGVDPYGIKIMLPKAVSFTVRIDSLSSIAANILKQEMLSLGGDAAIARDALTGKAKTTGCLLMGTRAQLERLCAKLLRQPFGLGCLSRQLSGLLARCRNDTFVIRAAGARIDASGRTLVMGIINCTPDSFSQDGLYPKFGIEYVVERARDMVEQGADILDIGGESTRPGARSVSLKEELLRTIPLIKALARKIRVPLSIDTRKPEVARQALDNGAAIVNDITGLRDERMRRVVARYKAGAVIMHMKGTPRTMQRAPVYKDVVLEIKWFLEKALEKALEAGIRREGLIVDPGIGFGKTCEHNLEILRRLGEFRGLGQPILVGPSRKSFIGKILEAGPGERLFGTVSSCVLAAAHGARIVRVHDVAEVKQALKVFDSIEREERA